MSGFLLVLLSHLTVVAYAPFFETGSDVVPRAVWILCALSLFIYHTMDNMDGKQARKTGNSSPLGLICDHGCDALNAYISSLTFACCIGWPLTFPNYFAIFAAFTNGVLPFYFATWEEFYVGKLVFGIINGPNEGVYTLILVYLLTGIFGTVYYSSCVWSPFLLILSLSLSPST